MHPIVGSTEDRMAQSPHPDPSMTTARQASTIDVAVTIGTTVALLAASVLMFGSDSSSGANQIALVIGAVIATIVGV